MLATTSLDVISWPLWNLTPLRSWKVQTVASLFGLQLVASAGRTLACGSVNVRYSPGMPANASDPPSLSFHGSSELPGAVMPSRSVPPACTGSSCAPKATSASPT